MSTFSLLNSSSQTTCYRSREIRQFLYPHTINRPITCAISPQKMSSSSKTAPPTIETVTILTQTSKRGVWTCLRKLKKDLDQMGWEFCQYQTFLGILHCVKIF